MKKQADYIKRIEIKGLGQILNDINILTAAVIPFSGVSLGIFIGQVRTHRGQNSVADKILGCNQFKMFALARQLFTHRAAKLRINSFDRFEINHNPYLPF